MDILLAFIIAIVIAFVEYVLALNLCLIIYDGSFGSLVVFQLLIVTVMLCIVICYFKKKTDKIIAYLEYLHDSTFKKKEEE